MKRTMMMKRTMTILYGSIRGTWRQNPALRRLAAASIPVLALCMLLGGLRYAMLAAGYLQLVFRAVAPGELVESGPRERASMCIGGLTRMLFFTGMMTHAAWPLYLMAAAQAFSLLVLRLGERGGVELSLLPVLSAACFLLLGLAFGAKVQAAQIALVSALLLTLARLLIQKRQTMNQLAMRFHLA